MEMPISLSAAVLILPALALAQDAQTPRVAVTPFAALSGDVPQRAGIKAAALLSTELKNAAGLHLVELPTARPEPFREALDEARRGVEEAKELRSKRKFRVAEAALSKALERYAKAAPGLAEVAELQDAYVLLSAVQFNAGRDEEAARSLAQGLALAPSREPPLASTSPLFARVVAAARTSILQSAKGTLRVESTPSGAAVFIDGVAMGATPLQVGEVPPGLHLWRVLLPSGEAAGGLVQIAPSQSARVSARTPGSDPESRLLAALSENRIDQPAVEAAREHARSVQADMLIFGALSREGRSLALDSFVLKVSSGEVKRLPRFNFDTELLSAGVEFYNLAGRLAKEGVRTGADARLPSPVSSELKTGGTRAAEVVYGADRNAAADELDGAGPPVTGTGERKPPEQKKRSPLRRPPQ
jgi:PEGA domain